MSAFSSPKLYDRIAEADGAECASALVGIQHLRIAIERVRQVSATLVMARLLEGIDEDVRGEIDGTLANLCLDGVEKALGERLASLEACEAA